MKFEEYIAYDATGLAGLVRSGDVAPSDPAQTALKVAAALNPLLGAIVELWPEEAEHIGSQAEHRALPLSGVPFLIKDLVIQRAGRLNEMGSRLAQGVVAKKNSFLMDRFDEMGLVTLGRTNTPELGHSCTTEPVANGPTRNPWDLTCMAGGSSGGSAAAVAAGIVPVAHANDGAGSIRIPASCCGLLGLKPSRGRVSAGPGAGEGLLGMGVELALTRSVRDMAALLDGAAKPAPGDPFSITPSPSCGYASALSCRRPKLRIAMAVTPCYDAPVSADVADRVAAAGQLLADMGHHVEEATPTFNYESLRRSCLMAWASGMATWIDALALDTGRSVDADHLEAGTLAMYEYGKSLKASDLLWVLSAFNEITRSIGAFFETYDLLLTPSTALPAQPLGTYDQNQPVDGPEDWFDRKAKFPPFLALFNVTGQPAISIPFGLVNGLPAGIQLVSRFGREDQLLGLAHDIETARQWEGDLRAMQARLWQTAHHESQTV